MEAIKRGLCSIIPRQALSLLCWQELKGKVCGEPTLGMLTWSVVKARGAALIELCLNCSFGFPEKANGLRTEEIYRSVYIGSKLLANLRIILGSRSGKVSAVRMGEIAFAA